MWRRSLKMFPEHPFFGYGFWTTNVYAFPDYHLLGYRKGVTHGHFNFHNTYLQFAVETGLFGLLAVLGLFAPGLRLALRRFGDPDPEVRMWSRIAIALLLQLAIHATTEGLLDYRLIFYLYGLLTAWAWTQLSPASASEADA